MKEDEVLEANKKSLGGEHQAWLQHPMTQQMLKVLDNYEKRVVDLLINDLKPDKPEISHQHALELKASRSVRDTITKTELFVGRSFQK